MADTVKAAKPKKVAKPKVAPTHPKYINMVVVAIKDLKERKGSSRAAILKHIIANNKVGTDVNKINPRVKVALRNGVKTGALKQTKGTGASGSFKVGENKEEKPKKKAPAKKPKVAKAKKPAAAKKPKAAKKSPKKVKKAKTPKKAAAKPAAKKAAKPKKPAAKKSPKKTKAGKPKAAKKAAGKK